MTDIKKYPLKKIGIAFFVLIACVVIFALTFFLIPTAKTHYNTAPVQTMNIIQTVNATGQVVAEQEAVLAFDTPGTIASVNVDVGDVVTKGQTLATLSSDILAASLESAQANTSAAQADLVEMQNGPRPQELSVYQQKLSDATVAFGNAIHDAYLKTQDAVENNADQLFNNPTSANPDINVQTQNQSTRNDIDNERVTVGQKILALQTALAQSSTTVVSTNIQAVASDTLEYAKNFLNNLNTITNQLSSANSGIPQSEINADHAIVSGAASEVNAAEEEYVGAQSAYSDAQDALTLEQAGNTSEDIQAQSAKVAAARASADVIQSQINHTVITAPFDGIITDSEHKVGEVVSAGSPAFTMITPVLKVEVQVSENDIGKIMLNDMATVTLDAYGDNVPFQATVTEIDPAETVVNGVNTYKVTLHFTASDNRIRSGMTANAVITTATANNTLAVPTQTIITKNGSTFVLVQGADGTFAEEPVQTGIAGSNGYTAIISGLQANDTIASFGVGSSQ